MADLLPSSPDTSAGEDTDPRVVGLDSEDADELLDALSSSTARSVLSTLHDEPDTPSGVADRIDTSLQNAQYHLDNLEEAGAIEVVDTAYSEKGREMNVYAPADRPLVVFAGQDEATSTLRSALGRLIGGVAAVGLAGVVVEAVFGESLLGSSEQGDGGDIGVMETTTDAAAESAAALPPGLLFFLGGVSVLLAVFAFWYVRSYRPA
jgi:DNA-binding transcriptional ArsR family regulator